MRIIGFNTTRIHGLKQKEIPRSSINTDILFTNIEKESFEMLKDAEAIKASFRFAIMFREPEKREQDKKSEKSDKSENQNEVSFEGSILLALEKDEAKEFIKSWKKKEIPKDKVLPLYNFILKKCSVRALQLEEELGLPSHIPFPQIKNLPDKQ